MKRKKRIFVVFSILCCIALYPIYASQPIEINCNNITVSPEVDHCAREKLEESKKVLLNTLRKFEDRTKRLYSADQKLGNDLIVLVKSSQEAWIIYRDLNCKLEAFEIEEDNPAYITTVNNCVIRMNSERVEMLDGL